MTRAIRTDVEHRISGYESLGRQNETFVAWGISPTSKGPERSYDQRPDPLAEMAKDYHDQDDGVIVRETDR